MSIFNKTTALHRRFIDDEKGNMGLTFALTATVMIGLMGAAMDYSTLSNAHKRSQNIADSIALNAAIFVKNHGRAPENNEEGYMDGQKYSAADLGYDFKGWVAGGADNVDVKVIYDDNKKEAIVKVSGKTVPTFMQVMGKERLDFSTESVVSYMQVDEKFPASIALVLDTSGSMQWDDKFAETDGSSPDDAAPRIDGLKTSVKNFNRDLKRRLGQQNNQIHRTIRMGMLPYSSEIITSGQVNMKWGFIGNNKVNALTPSGSTNSNPPMAMAKTWLDGEEAKHRREATRNNEDYKEPLKFVIFMTDGQNTVGDFEFIPDQESNRFYAYKSLFGKSTRWWYSGSSPYDGDFQEGWLRRDTDRLTIDTCNDMNEEGIEVFTIGYALQVGLYNANNEYDEYDTEPVTHEMNAAAHALLAACATEAENFIEANDGEELVAAFDRIQNAIVEELIRIKS
ncbi:pilus assembly protein TadG-related protein [Litorimonas sp. RW-G-Af-16]|uniref:TadE/TadG family type IV pilus assembly protein n=1 Tax=Litorimonas sp. RW-G-Af-16 TaxID=3241168 RepID=UPI00390C7ACA